MHTLPIGQLTRRKAARARPGRCDFALVALLGLLGLRIFEATGADIADLSEEHGHRVLRVCGKGGKIVLVPLPPAVSRAIGDHGSGPILRNSRGARIDRHAAAPPPAAGLLPGVMNGQPAARVRAQTQGW